MSFDRVEKMDDAFKNKEFLENEFVNKGNPFTIFWEEVSIFSLAAWPHLWTK